MPTRSAISYRQAAAEGATYIGLLLVVYDTLAEDLRRAGQAVAHGNIAGRCDATNHALLLLGHLESWISSLEDSLLQQSLTTFYAYLRSQILTLQAQSSPEPFQELARLVGETRAVWHKKESLSRLPAPIEVAQPNTSSSVNDRSPTRFSWSA